MAGLRRLGVEIAIDDFGTGYSSLSYLRRLQVDVVKLDRSFVSGMTENPRDEAVVAAMVELAHALGLRVIAEGVETEEQLATLEALGCDSMQGFLLAEPLDERALLPVLTGRSADSCAMLAGWRHRAAVLP
jgi:EAL domain-containing protein (putative c-di-GMP-specific phosphodiesterase class I)